MKKTGIFVLILAVLAGGFLFSVYYTGKKTDEFFHHNNGVLYNNSGLKWVLTDSKKEFFSGKYQTELSTDNETLFTFEHNAEFGININPLGFGNIDTKINITAQKELSKLSDKEFRLRSVITLNGINTDIFVEGGDISEYNIFSGEFENLTWKDINAKIFVSFKKDLFDIDAYIPLVKIDASRSEFLILKEQKYKGRFSKKELDLWLGNWDISAESIEFDLIDIKFLLSNFNFKTQIGQDKPSMLKHVNKISFGELEYHSLPTGDDLLLNDVIFNINFENLDAKSIREITKTFEIDAADEQQFAAALISSSAYMSDIFAKQPKITLEEFSGKYSNASGKISGFVQYMGGGNLDDYTDFANHIELKINFDIDEDIFKEFFKRQIYASYYGYDPEYEANFEENMENEVALSMESLEETLGVGSENGAYKGVFEFKNGEFSLNGKVYEKVF
ncbi:MAG: YdgA family protein [Campylobacteraceae bacterium]|nr:YdgA family protein [Campylobacteraceae bacterium]